MQKGGIEMKIVIECTPKEASGLVLNLMPQEVNEGSSNSDEPTPSLRIDLSNRTVEKLLNI